MSLFFKKVPLEIRNLIYEELLVDHENSVGPKCDPKPVTKPDIFQDFLISQENPIDLQCGGGLDSKLFDGPGPDTGSNNFRDLLGLREQDPVDPQSDGGPDSRLDTKKLYSTILRTCKQAYAEGSIILYERNVFRVGPTSSRHRGFVDCVLENKIFLGIKHLELAYGGGVQIRRPGHNAAEALATTTVMNTLASFDCTLKTLRLDFVSSAEKISLEDLLNDLLRYDSTNAVTARLSRGFGIEEDFKDTIVKLKVESMIKLSITSGKAADFAIFQEIASAIGSEKHWAVMEVPYAMPLEPTLSRKQWVLTPGISATREKVPALVGKAQVGSSKDRVVEVVEDES